MKKPLSSLLLVVDACNEFNYLIINKTFTVNSDQTKAGLSFMLKFSISPLCLSVSFLRLRPTAWTNCHDFLQEGSLFLSQAIYVNFVLHFSFLTPSKLKWWKHGFSQCKLFSKASLWPNCMLNWKTNNIMQVAILMFYKNVFLSFICISNGKLRNSRKLQICSISSKFWYFLTAFYTFIL